LHSMPNVLDALEVLAAGPPHHADDAIALLEQELGEVGAVLPGDAGDQCASSRHLSAGARGRASSPTDRAGSAGTESPAASRSGRSIWTRHRPGSGRPKDAVASDPPSLRSNARVTGTAENPVPPESTRPGPSRYCRPRPACRAGGAASRRG